MMDLTPDEKEEALKVLASRELAKRSLLEFTKYTWPFAEKIGSTPSETEQRMFFQPTTFHRTYYEILTLFAQNKIKKLIITVPPQHGKSEGSTRRLPAFLLGHNPHLKIAVVSYGASKAQQFNRDVQRIVDSQSYKNLFPDTALNSARASDASHKVLRNSTEFQIVNTAGTLKAVGRGGALTGDPVDIAILDDLYKDYSEGASPIIRQNVIDFYNSVLVKRLHNDSQQIIVFTRWDDNDLIGYLEKTDDVVTLSSYEDIEIAQKNNAWVKINFPAVMNHEKTQLDDRDMGQALYPEKHDLHKLESERKLDEHMFESMNQGNPKPRVGLLYMREFKTYEKLPMYPRAFNNYIDVADRGKDYLCSLCYCISADNFVYITDIYYTQEPQEITEKYVAHQLLLNRVTESYIESNSGGEAFARNVDRLSEKKIVIRPFFQSLNKESRILTNAPLVQERILMPVGWEAKYRDFYLAVTNFKKDFNANSHDDAVDALTGVLEKSAVAESNRFALYDW